MAADVAFDAIEQILIRLDAKDLIRYKSVCKSWHSLISTPYFVESHLKHINNNNNDRKRIIIDLYGIGSESDLLADNTLFIIGSSNGLVCISPEDFQLLVVNPCTRETMKILQPPPEPLPKSDQRWHMVWGFGYDSSNNDYKIVVGLVKKNRQRTRFYVLSLKTCLWKFIEENDYVASNFNSISGILCDGVLHWFMGNSKNKGQVILSFKLSREEFTETQQPDHDDHPSYEYGYSYNLGVMEECLCIYDSRLPSTKIWVLRSYNSGKQSWVLLPHNYVMNYDVVYVMNYDDYSLDDMPQLSNTGEYIGAPIFVQSLVSPHVNMDSSSKSDVVISVEEEVEDKEAGKEECKRLLL